MELINQIYLEAEITEIDAITAQALQTRHD